MMIMLLLLLWKIIPQLQRRRSCSSVSFVSSSLTIAIARRKRGRTENPSTKTELLLEDVAAIVVAVAAQVVIVVITVSIISNITITKTSCSRCGCRCRREYTESPGTVRPLDVHITVLFIVSCIDAIPCLLPMQSNPIRLFWAPLFPFVWFVRAFVRLPSPSSLSLSLLSFLLTKKSGSY